MAKRIDSKLLETIKEELENLIKSKKDHSCFDSGQLDPYLVASIINSYAKKEFPGQFYLEVKGDKIGGQIFVYKKQSKAK